MCITIELDLDFDLIVLLFQVEKMRFKVLKVLAVHCLFSLLFFLEKYLIWSPSSSTLIKIEIFPQNTL